MSRQGENQVEKWNINIGQRKMIYCNIRQREVENVGRGFIFFSELVMGIDDNDICIVLIS